MPKYAKLSSIQAKDLVHSFLKAAKSNNVDACVIYTEHADGKSISRASANRSDGIAKAAATLKFKDDAVEAGAAVLHRLASVLRPVPWWRRWWRVPGELPDVKPFAKLDSATQGNYRRVVAALLAVASEHGVHSPGEDSPRI